MTLLRRCLLALLLIVSAPALAAGDADWLYRGSDIQRDPAWTFGTLPNGLRYAVRQNKLPAGQVSIRVRIDAGSLHEADHERGWAHLVEHMAFRGSKSFGDREARHIWQTSGASFGSDTNASTTPSQTVYQLDLPKNARADLDRSLHVLAEMVDTALFDAAAVEAEKKIVLQERGRMPELSLKLQETSWPLFYAGLKLENRLTIGTERTLQAANAAGLRAFYERWYRPERATVVMVGDADPKLMQELIAARFGDWKGAAPPPTEPDFGSIRRLKQRAAALAYPGAPYAATTMWLRPYRKLPNTKERERVDLMRSLGARIINRRFEAKARTGAAYLGAALGESRTTHVADVTQLQLTAREGKWQEALSESFSIIADALRAPPSAGEIEREIRNLRTSAQSGVESEATYKSPQWASRLVDAVDDETVVASARTSLELVNELAPLMTPAAVGEGMKMLFTGAGPRLVLLSPTPVTLPAVNSALAAAEKVAPATRMAERKVSMDDLPKLGPPGKEVSRQRIEDLGVTIVRFVNGSSLLFKQTGFEKGSVQVRLRFGEGLLGLPRNEPTLAWLAGLVAPSGVADLDQDGLERLLTGRRMNLSFSVAEDALVLAGSTNGTDLADQLRLLATKLAYPRWDELLFGRFKTGALESYDLSFSSAASRAGRELSGFMRPGDRRWSPVEKAEIAKVKVADLRDFFSPLMSNGPIEAIIVGDVDIETAVAAVANSIGALPPRAPARVPAGALEVKAPKPSPTPQTFTHTGDKNQAYALIGWTTFGGQDRTRERRALSLAANILSVRLFERLREVEGASYSPSALSASSEDLPEWGVFYAGSELRPESAPTFFRIARELVAELASKPIPADEFARAKNPIVSGIERRLQTNGYWVAEMEDWSRQPELMARTRTFLSDFRGMTAEDVRSAVANHVTDAGDWSMLVLPGKAAGGGN